MRHSATWASWTGRLAVVLGVSAAAFERPASAEAFLVKDGQPCAQIVIAEKPTRMAKLAARELQDYLFKISGAKLPVTAEPAADPPVRIYVGKSAHTERLKLNDDGLRHDAFRMVSGENWLALLGPEADFVPRKPYPETRGDIPRMLQEWDALTGEKWGNPHSGMFKQYCKQLDIWELDQRGTPNAVYEFLRGLGVRWYFPGEVGEVTPKAANIPLPKVDKVCRPDFAVRDIHMYYNQFFMGSADEIMWQLRLGLNRGYDVLGISRGHGINGVHSRDEVKKAHPEYFALWGGKRATEHKGSGAPCLSSEGLFQSNVKYVRALFDIYGEPMVNVTPADGYGSLCQCDLCQGKSNPERGWSGQLSEYVWSYVNRLAAEVHKTHPDRKVTGLAYSSYLLPPQKIETLNPNIAVIMCRWRGDFHDREVRERFTKLVQEWRDKLPSKELYIWDYYLHGRPGSPYEGVPVYYPRVIAEDLRLLKGVSGGDFIEVYRNLAADEQKRHSLATNHLNIYVTARLYWDVNQDVDAMLEDYYDKFYGPAAKEMKAFVEYSEANWMKANKEMPVIDRMSELLAAAQKAAGDTVFGRRVALVAQYAEPLKQLRERLAAGRQPPREARALLRNTADFKLDGKLDESFWEGLPVYRLGDLATGKAPPCGTTFRLAWADDALCLGIQCQDPDTKTLNIAGRQNEDTNVWNGDCVEILLETQTHSYYQIAISPSGALIDADRRKGINILWSSGAKVAASIGEGSWSLEVRIPAAGDNAEEEDPLNGVSGRRPSKTYPWYINVCRQRMRDGVRELSAFCATGGTHFHDRTKFAELIVR